MYKESSNTQTESATVEKLIEQQAQLAELIDAFALTLGPDYDREQAPIVPAIPRKPADHILEIQCPYCNARHFHGRRGGNGFRASNCARGAYVIVEVARDRLPALAG